MTLQYFTGSGPGTKCLRAGQRTGPAAKKAGTQRLFERTKRKGTEETGFGTCGFQRGFGCTGGHPEVSADKRTQTAGLLS